MTTPSEQHLAPGPLADPTGAVAAMLINRHKMPDRLLDKSAADLFSAPPVSSAFADPGRTYPTHTPTAAWVSAAAYHDSRSNDESVGNRIKESCDWYGISSEWDRLKAARPAEPEPAPVTKWAMPAIKKYPLDTADQVKSAVSYFFRYADRFQPDDRRTYAEEVVKCAADHPNLFDADTLWRLEAEAGLGLPAPTFHAEISVRAKKAREAGHNDLAEIIEKIAMEVNYGGGGDSSLANGGQLGTFRNAGEAANLLRQLDRRLGWDSGDPLPAIVGETPSTARAKLASAIRSGSGNWYHLADLDRVPDSACTELAGLCLVVSRAEKAAALADPNSPFERLLRSQGVEPFEHAPRERVDWKKEAAASVS